MIKEIRQYRNKDKLITEYTRDGETISHITEELYLTDEENKKIEDLAKEELKKLKDENQAREDIIKAFPELQEYNKQLQEELASAQAINKTNMLGIMELANRLRDLEEKQW